MVNIKNPFVARFINAAIDGAVIYHGDNQGIRHMIDNGEKIIIFNSPESAIYV